MLWLAKLLMGAGLGEDAAKLLAKIIPWVVGVLLLLGALWWLRSDAYADGVRDTNASWEKAFHKADQQAAAAAGNASAAALERAKAHDDRVREEKDKIDDAKAKGSSPLDALFPAGG